MRRLRAYIALTLLLGYSTAATEMVVGMVRDASLHHESPVAAALHRASHHGVPGHQHMPAESPDAPAESHTGAESPRTPVESMSHDADGVAHLHVAEAVDAGAGSHLGSEMLQDGRTDHQHDTGADCCTHVHGVSLPSVVLVDLVTAETRSTEAEPLVRSGSSRRAHFNPPRA